MMTRLLSWFFGTDSDHIPHWSDRVSRDERLHLERLGLSGFSYSWYPAYQARISAAKREAA